jgi:hypothetical protein
VGYSFSKKPRRREQNEHTPHHTNTPHTQSSTTSNTITPPSITPFPRLSTQHSPPRRSSHYENPEQCWENFARIIRFHNYTRMIYDNSTFAGRGSHS